jgi:hypothetical protein
MPHNTPVPLSLVREIVKVTMARAGTKSRVPKVLTGTVEDLDAETHDVAFVRMDAEAMGSDPTQSDNWGAPGVIPTTRLGETALDEQVRVTFDGAAGASAMRTSGPGTGQRMVVDQTTGTVAFYDTDNEIVGFLDATRWELGKTGEALARLDPLGGLRLRDENDILRVQLSAPEGLIVREAASGISGLIAAADGLIVLDPTTGERISITSGTASAVPTPRWASTQATSPGSSHSTPAIASFDTGDDLDLRFVCASAAADLGTQTYTPPTGYTEIGDIVGSGSGMTLGVGAASKDPADAAPADASFTNTSSGWTRRNGHSVIVRGGGTSSPSVRASVGLAVATSTTKSFDLSITKPTGTAEGDLMLGFVSIASSQVPVGWTVPEGWKQLGVQVCGLGTSHVLSSGIWYKRAGASEPASYPVSVNMSAAGLTKVQAFAVAVQNPYGYPAGLDIRRNNRSMPRGRIGEHVADTSTTAFADTDLPQTVAEITGLEMLAGRDYRIGYDCAAYIFASLDADNRVGMNIQLDTGSGYADWFRVLTRQMATAGTEVASISNARTYTPATNETVSVRVQLVDLVTGAQGYSIQLAAGSSVSARTLAADDVGATF